MWPYRNIVTYAPESGTGTGGDQGTGGAGGAAGGAGGAGAGTGTPWHQGLDADILGLANNKGWDMSKPETAFSLAAKAYKEAQSKFGVPPEELVRLPKQGAQPADIDKFWTTIGVPKEAKDYDLTGLKFAGKDLEDSFANALRQGLITARVTKENAALVARPILKYLEDADAEENAVMSGKIATEKAALEKSWGPNMEANMFIAKSALSKLAAAAGMSGDDAQQAWDALAKQGGIGASKTMEMLRVMGVRMGEDKYVTGGRAGDGINLPLSREGAVARLEELKKDTEFVKRYMNGDVRAAQEMAGLAAIIAGQARAA
jgi:hypothetical protein